MIAFSFNYFILYGFFAFIAILFALKVDVRQKQANVLGLIISLFFVIALVVLFGSRGVNVGTDTYLYRYQFSFYKKLDFGTEILVTWLMATIHLFTSNPQVYIFWLSLIFVVVLFLACANFSRLYNYNVLFVFFSFVSLYFFQSLGINIVRQGVALAFLFLGVGFYLKNPKNIVSWLLPVLVGIGFHVTSVFVLIIFILVELFQKLKLKSYVIIYGIFVILSFFKVSVLTFGNSIGKLFQGDRRDSYLNGDMLKEYNVGFKPQFVAFNTIFLIIFLLLRKYGQKQNNYDILLKAYIGMSCVFFLMFQIPYSDRWGVMSWMFIPFLFAPVFGENGKYRTSIAAILFLVCLFIIFQTMYYKP